MEKTQTEETVTFGLTSLEAKFGSSPLRKKPRSRMENKSNWEKRNERRRLNHKLNAFQWPFFSLGFSRSSNQSCLFLYFAYKFLVSERQRRKYRKTVTRKGKFLAYFLRRTTKKRSTTFSQKADRENDDVCVLARPVPPPSSRVPPNEKTTDRRWSGIGPPSDIRVLDLPFVGVKKPISRYSKHRLSKPAWAWQKWSYQAVVLLSIWSKKLGDWEIYNSKFCFVSNYRLNTVIFTDFWHY